MELRRFEVNNLRHSENISANTRYLYRSTRLVQVHVPVWHAFETLSAHGVYSVCLTYRSSLLAGRSRLHAGSIPPDIGMLVALEELDVSFNGLDGTFSEC